MSGMGVSATVRMEPEVCFPSPHRHANGQRLKGQWAIPLFYSGNMWRLFLDAALMRSAALCVRAGFIWLPPLRQ